MKPNKNTTIDDKYNVSCLLNYSFKTCKILLKNGSCHMYGHSMPIPRTDIDLVKTHGYRS